MNSENIYDAITDISDEFITAAQNTKLKKARSTFIRWCAVAASVALVVGLGIYATKNWFSIPIMPGGSAGGAGHAEGTVFMSYAGPVFPLTLTENADGITAVRNIVFDFEDFGYTKTMDYGVTWHHSDIRVSDEYTLTNNTSADVTAKLLYPFAGSFRDLAILQPSLYLDGQKIDAELYAGQYSGGFAGVLDGNDTDGTTLNLKPIDSWEGYKALLSDGEYLKAALSDIPELNRTVTVYEFKNPAAAPSDAVNPTLAASFDLDYSKTTVLAYGFHGGEFDRENGRMRQSFSVPGAMDSRLGDSFYLIAVGEDIQNLNIQGYIDGGCDEGEELDGVTADITRCEARLGDVLGELLDKFMSAYYNEQSVEQPGLKLDTEMLYRAAVELLYSYGALSENIADRYSEGWLEGIFSEMLSQDRVFYLSADIVIPAGEGVTFKADMVKHASYDFYCSGSENKGLYGYGIVTRLGSNLIFEAMSAELLNPEGIEIVRQNFGFDPDSGVTSVALDMDVEHYFMEVRGVS